jgi:hypothetical protein
MWLYPYWGCSSSSTAFGRSTGVSSPPVLVALIIVRCLQAAHILPPRHPLLHSVSTMTSSSLYITYMMGRMTSWALRHHFPAFCSGSLSEADSRTSTTRTPPPPNLWRCTLDKKQAHWAWLFPVADLSPGGGLKPPYRRKCCEAPLSPPRKRMKEEGARGGRSTGEHPLGLDPVFATGCFVRQLVVIMIDEGAWVCELVVTTVNLR